MNNHLPAQASERQRDLLNSATEQRNALWLRRLGKATRRAQRAERQLSRSWSHATRRHDELSRFANHGPS
ncbi:MAG: hypothetical protein ACRDNZ_06045 [Streptosporangiaceae bacterium]